MDTTGNTRTLSSYERRHGVHAGWKARERQEREAVRSVEGQGNVEGARGEDRELAGRVEPRWEEVRLVELVAQQLEPGRNDRAEEGGRTQGRPGNGEEVLTPL